MKKIIKQIHGKRYLYLEEAVRIKDQVRKISKYLGPVSKVSQKEIKAAQELFEKELPDKKIKLIVNLLSKKIKKLGSPLTWEEIKKIEEMNLKHKQIVKKLHPKDLEDLNKRFIANYVFESNALEGNSLTLKNVAEIVFEKRISKGKDLREIYDAQNSYQAFLSLTETRSPLTHDFIIKLHTKVVDKIDDRLGYRTVPVILVGKPTTRLSEPQNVRKDMENLLRWYGDNQDTLYPLELAFKFHAKFEKIHPFCDGNGRVGRFLLNYILLRKGYFPIIIRTTTRNSYIKALEAADRERWLVLIRFALKYYKETFRKFFEVYYRHLA
ncbi:MAG: Fic family protein [Candidatus Woesearchaeota archaeon]